MAGPAPALDIGGILGGVGDLATKVRQAITGEGDPAQKLKQVEDLLAAAQASDAAQNEVNVEEAKSTNWFVAAWRPMVGWICALGFAWATLLFPLATWACALWAPEVHLPAIDSSLIITTLGGMLGIGTMRTVEKLQGVHAK